MAAEEFKEVLWPPRGLIYDQEFMLPAHCKPKLIPLKTVTLERLEKMQRDALEKLKEMEKQTAAEEKESMQTSQRQAETRGDADIWKADD